MFKRTLTSTRYFAREIMITFETCNDTMTSFLNGRRLFLQYIWLNMCAPHMYVFLPELAIRFLMFTHFSYPIMCQVLWPVPCDLYVWSSAEALCRDIYCLDSAAFLFEDWPQRALLQLPTPWRRVAKWGQVLDDFGGGLLWSYHVLKHVISLLLYIHACVCRTAPSTISWIGTTRRVLGSRCL